MVGWFRAAADWASRRKRAWKVTSPAMSERSSLMAMMRDRRLSLTEVHLGHAATPDEVPDLVAACEDLGELGHSASCSGMVDTTACRAGRLAVLT